MAATTANIVQMTDAEGKKQYPVTSADAVGMPDGSGNLTNKIEKIEKGLNRSIFEAAGAVYNNTTGFYELNGLTNITEAQMSAIYNSQFVLDNGLYLFNYNSKTRTTFPRKTHVNPNLSVVFGDEYALSCNYLEAGDTIIEIFCFCKDSEVVYIKRLDYSFYRCYSLKAILGILDISRCTSGLTSNFNNCPKLESIKLKGLKSSIKFADSPLLSKDSILYMIKNSAATSAITILLHQDAYNMAISDIDIQAALEEKTFVSLITQ